MLFYSFFKSLVGKEVTVELKNDLCMIGTLQSVDQFLNIKLDNARASDAKRYPHVMTLKNCFIRGSVVRYVQLPSEAVDTALLQDATRRQASTGSRR
ncbi:U6 snRNA-associated Sm-like protein LSm2-like protein [Blastocladiella britannica]|nr:U6 snRNA-associated Sm-like protein LSm2-like protein [Blastocladiella britannica]